MDSETSSENNQLSFIKLSDTNTEIKYVYHLSDIHVRNIQRHVEYNEVFSRTYRKILSLMGNNKKYSLIVVTGDVVHTKTEMSPEVISMVYSFFKNLSDIAPVILIRGNHDCNVSNKSRMDALTPIVEDVGHIPDLYYLKNSGLYQYNNIIFGVTSIFDDTLVTADKIDKRMMDGMNHRNKYKIALFHGPVHSAMTDVGYRMNNDELLVEHFDGYDYVMLGDIHTYQYMNDEKTIAYSGSLIQQSYGESIDNHGFIKWDLIDRESQFYKIKNDYGYCTVKIVNGEMIPTYIPPKPRIRFITENTNQIQYQEILKKLQKEYQICEIVKDSSFKTNVPNNISPSHKKNKKQISACDTQEQIIQKYLKHKLSDEIQIANIIKLHKMIYQRVLSEKKDQVADVMHNTTKKQKWNILVLKFSNVLLYGRDNVIDFQKYQSNNIIGIMAPNEYGKSAILDIILFCLFDKCSRGDRKDILHNSENEMYCSLRLCVGSQHYLIERIGERNKNGLTVKIDVNFSAIMLHKDGTETIESLNGLDKNDTNRKITDLVGNYDDYLTTCFCLQNDKTRDKKNTGNFIDMTQTQKKEYLNEILKLNVFEDCHEVAKVKMKDLIVQTKVMEQNSRYGSLDEMKGQTSVCTQEIKTLERTKIHRQEISEMINTNVVLYETNTLHKYDDLSHYTLNSCIDIESTILDLTQSIKDVQNNTPHNIDHITEEIQLLKQEFTDTLFEQQNKLDKYQAILEDLLTKIIKIPNAKYDITTLLSEKSILHEKILAIDTQISNFEDIDGLDHQLAMIPEIQNEIIMLHKQIREIDPNIMNSITELEITYKDTQSTICRAIELQMQSGNLSPEQKKQLVYEMTLKTEFAQHVEQTIAMLNDHNMPSQIHDHNQDWLDNFNRWKKKVSLMLDTKECNLDDLFKKSKKIRTLLSNTYHDYYYVYDNAIRKQKLQKLETQMQHLQDLNNTKHELHSRIVERDMLLVKMTLIENQIQSYDEMLCQQESNKTVNEEIHAIKEKISTLTSEKKMIETQKNTILQRIHKREKIRADHADQITQYHQMKKHLVLLRKYQVEYSAWDGKNKSHKKWQTIKREFDAEMHVLDKKLETKKQELVAYKKVIQEYMIFRKEFDELSDELNLYQLYVQLTNYNGLPYELLKSYLPLIESDVNQILHSMVNFSIEFMFHDESLINAQKSKNQKSNIGCVNINVCYQGQNPLNVQMVSGFQKFIIGLAIRMTLCQISLTAKPNFLIIDEGWSCLDSDNLGNVGAILNYIKTQYEHVIIISHLDALKDQVDYTININKVDGYSYILPPKKIVCHKKQKRIISI